MGMFWLCKSVDDTKAAAKLFTVRTNGVWYICEVLRSLEMGRTLQEFPASVA
jgi:hypothetical protein